MIVGRRSATGDLYISTVAPQPGDVFVNGIAMTSDGVVRVTAATPQVFNNGLGMMNIGAIAVSFGGVIVSWQGGLPFADDGRLVCQLNQPASPGDGYVAGLRVGVLGGVYVTDAVPTPWIIAVDLDHDGHPDHIDLQIGPITVTDDDDSINIDLNSDGVADIVIPK